MWHAGYAGTGGMRQGRKKTARRSQIQILRQKKELGPQAPTAARSPWQNGYCERAIGSIRQYCLDHVIVLGERHLIHLLLCYASYYNRSRTHLSLNKDAPTRRPVHALGSIEARPVLGGLHHHYVRI
jgi:transposase InsO family protein